jgi:type 1 glutamine amidotransferase
VTEVGPEEFEDYIRAGGGFLAVHSGLAYRKDQCPAYCNLVGSAFITHPPRCTVNMTVTNPAHPVAAGVPDFSLRDEHYAMEMLCDDVDVFLKSTSEKGGTQTAGYTRTLGNGRLCVLTPGHTLDVWEDPHFQTLFTQALEWCLKER